MSIFILQKLREFTQHAVNFLLPYRCVLCNNAASNQFNLCSMCLSIMPWLEHCCVICANPFKSFGLLQKELNPTQICGQCLKQNPLFQKTTCLFLYEKPASVLVTQLKFQHHLLLANSLGKLLEKKLKALYQNQLPNLLMPVPLHPKRLRQRGFNQALEIARPLSRLCKIPLDKKSLIRVRSTLAQSEIKAKQRSRNVKNAFECRTDLQNSHILLIDDVITTGHTVHECCKALIKAGAGKVDVCAVARTKLF